MHGYKIADLSVNMRVDGRTYRQAEKYKISDAPFADAKITVDVSADRLADFARRFAPCSLELAEYVLSGRDFYKNLLQYNGFMLHASAVVLDGKAYLFSADSGVGKSTHTSLWCECFDNAYIINDDKPAIRLIDGEFVVYGTPWNGKGERNVNARVPLGGICFLKRGSTNSIRTMNTAEVLGNMMKQTVRFGLNEPEISALLSIWNALLNQYRVFELSCLPDREAVEVAYEALKGAKNED